MFKVIDTFKATEKKGGCVVSCGIAEVLEEFNREVK